MNTKKLRLRNYRKYLLTKATIYPQVLEFIDDCIATDSEDAKYSFHKIMVRNWMDNDVQLFETLSEYFTTTFIPVGYTTLGDITRFHTSSLTLIQKMIKLDLTFIYHRSTFNIDIIFNDCSSDEYFDNSLTVEDIITSVVSNRFTEHYELNLSNFCNDPEFSQKSINFYKLSLLAYYKILMLRMGRDTKLLNLSNNNLSQIPIEIFNFFIKGNLIAVNLSNNNIQSITELHRVSSKIEKLWVEGNPLCDNIDPTTYVKQILIKFPRLTELDGITLNQHGIMFPFFRNYLAVPNKITKMVVEKFLHLYFAHYDCMPRRKIDNFYDTSAVLTITTDFPDSVEETMPYYANHSRNILHPGKRRFVMNKNKIYSTRDAVVGVLVQFAETEHDPSSFAVDVLVHDKKCLILVVDGIYKEKPSNRVFQFRRTFVFSIYVMNVTSVYHITNEMFNVSLATQEQIANSFKIPRRNMNSLVLIEPKPEEAEAICRAFAHLTQLKKEEALLRLKANNWDIRVAIKKFTQELKNDISSSIFVVEDDDLSDLSSLTDDLD